jgi:GPI mannosyltransferase 2
MDIKKWHSTTQLMRTAVLFRMGLLLAMALSCHIIPDHNPGDDVLRYDLRLRLEEDSSSPCFCLAGFACDETFIVIKNQSTHPECASLQHPISTTNHSATKTFIYRFLLSPVTKWDAARFLTLAANPSVRDPALHCFSSSDSTECSNHDPFLESEQAHAFFPLFPWCIRAMGDVLINVLSPTLLPPTYEATLALSAILLNTGLFLLTLYGLYDLTIHLFSPDYAILICQLFMFNPASIFFATAYSESIFCMLTVWGHAFAARGSLELAIVPWTLSTFARSNGTIHSAWILLHGIGKLCSSKSYRRGIGKLIYSGVLAFVVALPLRIHDMQGYNRHCSRGNDDSNTTFIPKWCSYYDIGSMHFSLYGYIQRKHWNVGFFRYYEWRQVPNFVLAAPVLIIGLYGAWSWIATSVHSFTKDKSLGIGVLTRWAVTALRLSVVPTTTTISLVDNPRLLGHYAVLAATCLVGLFLAHVQISTRMIFSTCPAIYFFLADCCMKSQIVFQAIKVYFGLYILLGVILHVNFLPWT